MVINVRIQGEFPWWAPRQVVCPGNRYLELTKGPSIQSSLWWLVGGYHRLGEGRLTLSIHIFVLASGWQLVVLTSSFTGWHLVSYMALVHCAYVRTATKDSLPRAPGKPCDTHSIVQQN